MEEVRVIKVKSNIFTHMSAGLLMLAIIVSLVGYQVPVLFALVIGIFAGMGMHITIMMFMAKYAEIQHRKTSIFP